MKKTLSIILAILMIVTTVPMAFAADGETKQLYLKISDGYMSMAMVPDLYVEDDAGNEIKYDYEEYVGDDTYSYKIPADTELIYWDYHIGGGSADDDGGLPFFELPDGVDTYYYDNDVWYCSHQMNTSGEQNCKGFLCEICGETYGEADLSAHKIKDGICEVCGEADPDAPLIIDVTDEAYVGLGEGARFYDEDGYIITGTNENCDINVYESSNITLRNLSAKSMRINCSDSAFITIKLEGINELAEDLSLYKDHIIFEGSDDAIFKADYIYNGGNGEASVTLNGGNIVFESVSRENFTVYCGKLIINGGTLTASNDSDYVIGSPVELNGGELNIISTSQQYPAILKKITMKKGALLTLSAKTRILDNSAEITVADGLAESDNLFVRYDTESEFVLVHDIKEALDGKTYAEIKVDTHVHSYEDSKWNYSTEKHWKKCSCGVISEEAEHTYTDGKCVCGKNCSHSESTDGKCDACGAQAKNLLSIIMSDGYGDGWNGNAIQVCTVSDGVFTEIANTTVAEGSSYVFEMGMFDGDVYALKWLRGNYAYECSFSIAIDGVTVYESSDCDNFDDNKLIYISCDHNFVNSICSTCGLVCGVDFDHTMNGDECSACGYVCNHVYTNHYCKICGNVEDGYYAGVCGAAKADDAIWSLGSEGTLTISGEGEYSVPYVDTPWDDYSENIKNVVIEEGITNIDDGSFYYLTNAVTLSIPSTVTTINVTSNYEFAEIKVAEGNNYYSVIDGVLFNYDKTDLIMYPAKKAGETYTVPDGVTTLGNSSFRYVKNLKTVNISDDVTAIEDSSFSYSSIENINFGENVAVIEISALSNTRLKTVVLPEKLTEIPDSVFWACSALEILVIGSKVTSIDSNIIRYCNNLKTVHFMGTEEQWQAITKPDNTEDEINTVNVHCGALEEKDATEATCREAGHTAGLYCDECNAYLTGEEIPATGNHTYVDGKCECGDECKHPGQTGAECEICGSALHVCDFSGEWNYSDEYHWKECSCGEISEEIAHTYIDGVCECGFVCLHDSITVYGWDFCYTCGYIVAEEIALDTPHTVTEDHFVKFIPEVSGSYYFRSYDTTDGADPEGYAYEGSIRNCLGFIGSNNNFLYGNPAYNEITFEAELTAGKTYYFELFEYRKTQNGEPFEYTVMIKKICDNGAHSFTDSICDVCGYECFHPVATEGVCDNCGSACTHNKQDKVITVRPVQNDDGTWEKGTVEITCLVCGNVETKEVERDHEGYKTFDETAAKLEALINSDELIDYPKSSFSGSLNNIKNSAYSQVYTEIEGAIPSMTDSLNSIIATIEAGLADGTMKKADWTYMTAILDEIKALIDNDPNKIIPSMVGYYYGPNGFYSSSFGNPNYPQSDYDRVMTEYGFKNQLETLLAGLKDGSALKADYTEIDEAIAEIEQKLADENVTDEAKADLEEIKSQLEEMKQNPISSAADLAELEKALEDYEAELDAGIEDGSAVKVDANKIMTEIVNEWVAELQAKDLMDDYEAFNADKKATEEAIAKEKEIIELAYSLEGSVADNAENIAKVEEALREFLADFTKCLEGTHCVKEYAVIEEAKCGENAVEEGTCWFCGEVLTREVENSALTHSFTKYEVTEEAKCGVEGKEVAYCDNGCGETDEKPIEALKHSFTKYEETEAPKCGVEGKEVALCDNGCGETDEKEIEALTHSFTNYEVTEEAKCGIAGKETALCDNGCGATDEKAIEALTHTDADGDYKCDNGCGHEFEKPAPEEPDTPDTPDEPTDDACDHLCHKSGFIGFIWKIVKFFSKLFKINPTCECGAAHY